MENIENISERARPMNTNFKITLKHTWCSYVCEIGWGKKGDGKGEIEKTRLYANKREEKFSFSGSTEAEARESRKKSHGKLSLLNVFKTFLVEIKNKVMNLRAPCWAPTLLYLLLK